MVAAEVTAVRAVQQAQYKVVLLVPGVDVSKLLQLRPPEQEALRNSSCMHRQHWSTFTPDAENAAVCSVFMGAFTTSKAALQQLCYPTVLYASSEESVLTFCLEQLASLLLSLQVFLGSAERSLDQVLLADNKHGRHAHGDFNTMLSLAHSP